MIQDVTPLLLLKEKLTEEESRAALFVKQYHDAEKENIGRDIAR